MTARRRPAFSKARLLPFFALAALLAIAPGCGEDPTQLAGTLDMPERKPSRPDFKAVAKAAKEARTKGKAKAVSAQ